MSTNVKKIFPNPEVAAVLNRLKAALNIKRDGDLAEVLGVSASTLSGWKGENSIPYARLDAVSRERGLSLDYLLHGDGPQQRAAHIAEAPAPYAPGAAEYELFIEIAHAIDALFKEAGVQVGREVTQDKRDHLVFYIYNDHIKQGYGDVQREIVRGAVRLAL